MSHDEPLYSGWPSESRDQVVYFPRL